MAEAFRFDCRLYIGGKEAINMVVPQETGPRKLIRLQPVSFQQLTDPVFAPLLVAFENVDRKITESAGSVAVVG